MICLLLHSFFNLSPIILPNPCIKTGYRQYWFKDQPMLCSWWYSFSPSLTDRWWWVRFNIPLFLIFLFLSLSLFLVPFFKLTPIVRHCPASHEEEYFLCSLHHTLFHFFPGFTSESCQPVSLSLSLRVSHPSLPLWTVSSQTQSWIRKSDPRHSSSDWNDESITVKIWERESAIRCNHQFWWICV